MKKFFQQSLCSQRSVVFTIIATWFLAAATFAPACAFAEANRNAYVANSSDGTVDVIDTKTDTVVATISGFTNPFGLAVSPNGKLLYVRNPTPNSSISVVDTETNTVRATIPLPLDGDSVGSGPSVAFNRHGERAYVAIGSGSLVIINTECNSVVATTPIPNFFPVAVAVSPDGDNVYVASGAGKGILVFDTDSNTITATIAAGHAITDLVMSSDGKRLYGSDNSTFFSAGSNGILVVDTATNTVNTEIAIPFNSSVLTGLALTLDGRHLYAANAIGGAIIARDSTVTVINTRNNSIETTIAANGLFLTSLATARSGKHILATQTNPTQSSMIVIETKTNSIVDSVKAGSFALSIATQPVNRHHRDDDDEHRDRD